MTLANNGRSAREYAAEYARAGLSVLPIRTDGSKAPTRGWKEQEFRILTPAQIERFFHRHTGVAIIGGQVSGGLECIDFDKAELFDEFAPLIEAVAPGLLARVTQHLTPRPGRHLAYRCPIVEGNQELAQEWGAVDPETGKRKIKTLIETRGEGGYFLAPGSPPACHEARRTYQHVAGPPITQVGMITPEERELLFSVARSFNRVVESDPEVSPSPKALETGRGSSPGDDFAAQTNWQDILTPHGWTEVSPRGDLTLWRRPGKDLGISATTGLRSNAGAELFCVFSTNADPFVVPTGKKCCSHGKFATYTLLNHDGDFTAATKALVARGFGEQPKTTERATQPPQKPEKKRVVSLSRRPRPFPTDALPPAVAQFVVATAAAMNCDAAYVALPVLSVMGAAIGNSRRLVLKRSWSEPAIIWTVVIGESGTTKSPVLEAVLKTVEELQTKALREHKLERKEYEQSLIEYEKAKSDYGKGKRPDVPEKPVEPVPRRFKCDNVTVESIAVLLRDNPKGLLLAKDELSGWFGSFDRYSQAKNSDAAHWLEMFGGRPMLIDRKSTAERIIHVPRAAVSLTGGVQPGVFSRCLTPAYREAGLLARMLVAYPARRSKIWTEEDLPEEIERPFKDMLAALFNLEMVKADGADDDLQPGLVRLHPDAKNAFVRFFDSHNFEAMNLSGDDAAAWAKLEGYVPRLALVLHLANCASGANRATDLLLTDSMHAAIRLVEWFKYEMQRVYELLSSSEEDRQQLWLLGWIEAKGGVVRVRDLTRGPKEYRSAVLAEDALNQLVKAGLGHWEAVPAGARGGQPTRQFVLDHDAAGDSDTTSQNTGEMGVVSHEATPKGALAVGSVTVAVGDTTAAESPPPGDTTLVIPEKHEVPSLSPQASDAFEAVNLQLLEVDDLSLQADDVDGRDGWERVAV